MPGRHAGIRLLKFEHQVFEKRSIILGEEHPDTLASMTTLGFFYQKLGNDQMAMELQRRAMEKYSQVRGSEDPLTISAAASLASTAQRLGYSKMSKGLQKQIADARLRSFERANPESGDALADTAQDLQI